MRNIIVPFDTTSAGINAARFAVEIASKKGMDVYLLDALELNGGFANSVFSQSVFEELLNNRQEQLKESTENLSVQAGNKVLIRSSLETGKIEEELSRMCRMKLPFLVVAAKGRRFRRLQFPLLLVPEDVRFREWKHVVLACDREDIHSCLGKARKMVEQLIEMYNPQFCSVHVLVEGEGSAGKIMTEYRAWSSELKGFDPELTLVRGVELGDSIAEFLNSHDTDLLMLFPKRHSWLESHTSGAEQIAAKASIPVMLCGPLVPESFRGLL